MIATGTNSDDVRARVERLRLAIDVTIADVERLRLARAKAGRVRRAAALAISIAVIGVCALAASVAPPGTEVAGPFVVIGRDNTQMLKIASAGSVNQMVLYRSGRPMLRIGSEEDWSFVSAQDGNATASLGVQGTRPYLRLGDGRPDRVSFDVTNGRPYVRLKGPDGHAVVELSVGESGGGELRMAKPAGYQRILAGVSAAGFGRVETWPQDPKYLRGSPLGAFIVGQR